MVTRSTHIRPTRAMNACRVGGWFAVATLAAIGPINLHAQESAPALEEIVVTATRVERSGFTAPTPTTMLSAQDLEARGFVNVADALNEVPTFRATVTPTGGATGTLANSGAAGQNLLDLRGLGPLRTLVLVNGRRHVPSNATGSVDLNFIPTILVERTETVTGGASAAWGSDAVAGVVNLMLKNDLVGLISDVSYGWSDQSDAEELRVSVAGGMQFAGERGHVVLGAEFVDGAEVGDYLSRDWGRKSYGIASNPLNASNGMPRNIIGPNMNLATQSANGVIATGPLAGTTFTHSNGVSGSRAFQYGQTFGTGAFMFGGEGYGVTNNTNQLLKAPVKHLSGLARASFDFNDDLTAWLELSGGEVASNTTNGSVRGNYTLRNDNAYLRAALTQTQLALLGTANVTLGRYNLDWGILDINARPKTGRAAAGLNGNLFGSWQWDAYYQAGEYQLKMTHFNNMNLANFNAALDAVNSGGSIVCRNPNLVTTTATGAQITAAPGCLPVNMLGAGAPSPAALDYLMGDSWFELTTKQRVAAANLRGDLFSTWAGPVSVATGLEYREEQANQTSDLTSQLNGWNVGNIKPLYGKYNVKEAYVETVVPLASGVRFAKQLDLNAAGRRTNYSTSGPVTTWKVGLTYQPVHTLLFRATRSRDIRAPNLLELFSSSTFALSPTINPVTGVSLGFVPTFTTGNRLLEPEIADTWTAGVVFTSPGSAFRVSVDTYQIEIADMIATLGGQQVLNRCVAGASDLCQYVTFNSAGRAGGVATAIINPQINLLGFETSGTDIELSYRFSLSSLFAGAGGDFNVRLLGTHVDHFETIDSGGRVERAGQTGVGALTSNVGVPKWLVNAIVSYHREPLSLTTQFRYIPSSIYDATLIGPDDSNYSPTASNSINDNSVPSRFYINLSGQYDLDIGGYSLQLYAVVNNLLDRDPPLIPTANVMTNAAYYDTIGRFYRMGARLKF